MTKGTLTIEFDSTSDLMSQLRVLLMGVGAVSAGGQLLPPSLDPICSKPISACGKASDVPMAAKPEPAPVAPAKEVTDVVKPSTPEQAPSPAPEPTPEKADPPAPEQAAPAGDGPVLTAETLKDQPYDVLLAFCAAHPEVGIEAEKCKPTFFRKLVENHITAYLGTVG